MSYIISCISYHIWAWVMESRNASANGVLANLWNACETTVARVVNRAASKFVESPWAPCKASKI